LARTTFGEYEEVVISNNEVIKRLRQLNEYTSMGPDGISSFILKRCAEEVALPLTVIFNDCLRRGVCLTSWKKANIVPIFKDGDRSDPLNYRPVSLTSIPCKVMERIIKDDIMEQLIDQKVINKGQHGFVKGKSTTTNLLEFYDFVLHHMDEGDLLDLMFLDIRKAFDTVCHQKLIKRLKEIGINMYYIRWIEDYLEGREQRVVVRGEYSEWVEISSGVPQGSVLGPLLFMVYVNNITRGINNFSNMFADDMKIVGLVNSEDQQQKLKNDINLIYDNIKELDLSMNVKKCKVMHLGYNNRNSCYYIEDKEILKTDSEKDLGVWINNRMNFKVHVEKIVKECNSFIGMIRRNFSNLTEDLVATLFKVMIRPRLEYAVQVWSPCLKGCIDELEKVQRRVTKLPRNLKDLDYEERLKRLKLQNLQARRIRGDMIYNYKILRGDVIMENRKLLELDLSTRTRGNSCKLRVQPSNLNVRHGFYSVRVVKNWNSLPDYVVKAPSVGSFKRRYDLHMENVVESRESIWTQ